MIGDLGGVALPNANEDPRKAAVVRGASMVVHGLIHTIGMYCCGPNSTPSVELELGDRLIEAGEALQKYGHAVRDGQVGKVGDRRH